MGIILQNQPFNKTFILVSSTDHVSPALGAHPNALISQNGEPFSAPQGVITELGYGWYIIAYTSKDTSIIGELALHVTAMGADNTDAVDQVLPTVAVW